MTKHSESRPLSKDEELNLARTEGDAPEEDIILNMSDLPIVHMDSLENKDTFKKAKADFKELLEKNKKDKRAIRKTGVVS